MRKILLVFLALYIISPIDIIPDLSLIGWLDDMLAFLLVLYELPKTKKD